MDRIDFTAIAEDYITLIAGKGYTVDTLAVALEAAHVKGAHTVSAPAASVYYTARKYGAL